MATVQFFNDYSWDNFPKGKVTGLNKKTIIERLSILRNEWEDTILQDGLTLLDAKGSIGLLLSDICELLEFNQEERISILGPTLNNQIDEMLNARNKILITEGGNDN